MPDLNEREKYMLDALTAIANFGKDAGVVLRPYMDEHHIKWHKDEDVKSWMQRIAKDALAYVETSK